MLHKPRGMLTANIDREKRRNTTVGLLHNKKWEHMELPPHLVAVGRLDFNSEGLLLFTNNGGCAASLERPSSAVTRDYLIRMHVAGMLAGGATQRGLKLQDNLVRRLKKGIRVDGVQYGPIILRTAETVPRPLALAKAMTKAMHRPTFKGVSRRNRGNTE